MITLIAFYTFFTSAFTIETLDYNKCKLEGFKDKYCEQFLMYKEFDKPKHSYYLNLLNR